MDVPARDAARARVEVWLRWPSIALRGERAVRIELCCDMLFSPSKSTRFAAGSREPSGFGLDSGGPAVMESGVKPHSLDR